MKTFFRSKSFYLDVIVIILGCFISSLGVNLFLSNAKLLSGGVTGYNTYGIYHLVLQYLYLIFPYSL